MFQVGDSVYRDDVIDIHAMIAKITRFFDCWTQEQTSLKLNEEITLSVGIARFPQHGTTYDALWSNADRALYEVKRNGKNGMALYQQDDEKNI